MSMHDGPGTDRESDGGLSDMGGAENDAVDSALDNFFSDIDDPGSYNPNFTDVGYNLIDGYHVVDAQAVKQGPLGGFMHTTYGWQNPDAYAEQYGRAKAAQKAKGAQALRNIQANTYNAFKNPAVIDSLIDPVNGIQLGRLQDMGLATPNQAQSVVDAYGGIMDRVGNAMGFGVDSIDHPAGSYVEGLDSGLINADGSLTGKGMFSIGAPLAATFGTGPLAGAVYGATGSLEGALGVAAGLQAAGTTGQSMGMTTDASAAASQVMDTIGVPGASQVAQMGNLAGLAEASGYGKYGLDGPSANAIADRATSEAATPGAASGEGSVNMFAEFAQPAQTQVADAGGGENMFWQFKNATNTSATTPSYSYNGLNKYLS